MDYTESACFDLHHFFEHIKPRKVVLDIILIIVYGVPFRNYHSFSVPGKLSLDLKEESNESLRQ